MAAAACLWGWAGTPAALGTIAGISVIFRGRRSRGKQQQEDSWVQPLPCQSWLPSQLWERSKTGGDGWRYGVKMLVSPCRCCSAWVYWGWRSTAGLVWLILSRRLHAFAQQAKRVPRWLAEPAPARLHRADAASLAGVPGTA